MGVEPRKHISSLQRASHGGPDYLELECLGIKPQDVLDFSANINPFGPPPEVLKAIREVPLEKYPDNDTLALRRAIARSVGTEPDKVLSGNGVSELIWLSASAYLSETDAVLIIGPTFGEYLDAARAAGARVYHRNSERESDFRPRIDEIVNTIKEISPRLVFLCNPNNPTGSYLEFEQVSALLESWEEGILVLDEAYVSFVEGPWSSLPFIDNGRAIIMRSLTKDCALAGIRLGYALAHESVIEVVEKVQPPWSVNAMAQEAGRVALDFEDYFKECLVKIIEAKDYLIRSFSDMGLVVVPSSAHYFMVEVGDAASFRKRLLMKGLQVRDCSSFGLPSFIRVSPRSMDDCKKLVEAVSTMSGK